MNKKILFLGLSTLFTCLLTLGVNINTKVYAESVDFKVGEKFQVQELKMGDKTYVIDLQSKDVTGDKINDSVILVGNKFFSKEEIYVKNLNIVVQDGKTKEFSKTTYENFSGYEGRLFVGDFTGDKIDDVMVSTCTGGSGAIYDHLISSFKDNKPLVIFSHKENDGIKVSGKFEDNFKAKLKFENINKDAELDLTAFKDLYISRKTYDKNGKLLKKVEPSSYPFQKLVPIYYGDKYYLIGYQQLAGTCHANTISQITSVWKYENSKWEIENLQYSTYVINK